MKKRMVTLSFLVLLLCSAFTLAKKWKAATENCRVSFELPAIHKQGSFGNLKAEIEFDEQHLPEARISASIDVSTIRVGNEKHEAHLKSADFFYAEKYPVISFVSTAIAKEEIGFIARGKLTMKDSTRSLDLPFTYQETEKGKALFSGTIALNASDFGVMKVNIPGADKVLVYLSVPVHE
jgi:polyisoprenoid-binding protein YceI